jgi:hypothetical protein
MSSDGFQNLLNKFSLNLRRHSTLYELPFQSYVDKPHTTISMICTGDPRETAVIYL